MSNEETHVIVGASLAGAKAAETLRTEGFDGRVVLIGAEPERPYERPPLTKGYLLGREPAEKAYVHDESWYDQHKVELRLGVTVTGIDRSAREVRLATGGPLRYDRLLLTTGASPRRLEVPGAELDGVHYVRTLQDSSALRDALSPGDRRVVVVGAGWIGLETAAAAREYGNTVVIIGPEATPLSRSLGPELGEVFAGLHRRHGVELRLGEGATELRGAGSGVSAVLTTAGQEVPADVVVVGVGARPNTGLAGSAGLKVDNGIVVDASLRTSDPHIYAAGDVANYYHPLFGRHLRVEHWANALNGGPAAARAMLGHDIGYDRVPFFFTDQYELGMEFSGLVVPGEYDEVIYRGDVEALEFIAFWLSEGRVVAGMNVNIWDVAPDVQALIRSGKPVDQDRLSDPGIPLTDLL
ncbi:MAG: 3-phenylpropionate/trans-cinnamate dioxygenase ferredoxin reductase component [Streptosporangiaceae bacterium]|jgi:NADPH-dependent 2,4-dienoyl-CoA reductase/sulfur reductase-like enzyme|nr:pyridine nucleotide-disulfide oxidoreductase [Streptosporangiaceae bacterium]MDX6429905.1 3-phenylpropionate/trans-cinnamate dioxygenase ferredoxin reductase component [Streptosporangiaceae bacterium]